MKQKVKRLITEQLLMKGKLKLTLHNLNAIGALDEEVQNKILDELREIDEVIQKLEVILKQI